MLVLALLAAALASPPSDAAIEQDLGLSVADLVAALPACRLGPGDGGLDLEAGCADGICVGIPVADAIAGFEASCKAVGFAADSPGVPCESDDGVSFWDSRLSTQRRSERLRQLYLRTGYDSTTATGLGLGVSLACFLAELGTPDDIELTRQGDRFVIAGLKYEAPRVWIDAVDGRVSKLTLLPAK